MTIKDILASCLVISLGIILVLHLALFWAWGGVYIYESNKVILLLETVMGIGILGFGVQRLLTFMKEIYKKEGLDIHHDMGQEQASTKYATLPRSFQAGGKPATPTATAATTMPGMTILLIDSSADYMENCSFKMCECTPNDACEPAARTEAVQIKRNG